MSSTFDAADYRQFRRFFETPFAIYLLWLTAVVGALALIYGYIVQVVLAEFRRALPLLPVLFIGLTFYNARAFGVSYIDGTRQMGRRTKALLFGIVVNAALCTLSGLMGWGELGLAGAISLSMVLASAHLLAPALRQVHDSGTARSVLLRLLGVACGLATVVGVLLWMPAWSLAVAVATPGWGEWLARAIDLGLRLFAYAAICYVSFALTFREYDVHREVCALLRHVLAWIPGFRRG